MYVLTLVKIRFNILGMCSNSDLEIAVELAAANQTEMDRWVKSLTQFMGSSNPDAQLLDDMYDQIRSASKINLSR